ncbi:MAG: LysM peptidoglycan-binding domain-containing protein [Anaerolineae bacterium]|nr:LysM peptidoglycan-binding domain-containing protein [Anaerolineae bacterium]NIN97222.1 LysM peptidoglycan-binding domain-containing protein [Anaerolineae bacterium]NIQ80174.1 LysM peptidoglycan-binding domain-containing protein [Anaerolineae bacterium]
MDKRRGCGKPIAVTLSVLAALACVALGVFAGLYLRQQRARAQFEPPSVTITYPDSGISTLAGSYLPVSATAFGAVPIARAELWVDGQLIETKESHVPEGVSPLHVSFNLLVTQGLHMVYVRAVNAMGIIGDSWPVNVGGVERPGPDDPARVVTVEEGQTLDDIATAYDVDPETARQLNPGLGGQEPPPGSEVVLPPPRSKVAPGPEGPPVGPRLPTGGTQPPDGGAQPPSTGQRLRVLPADPLISPRDIMALAMMGSPPAAPSILYAHVYDCTVRLVWMDDADNEERYEVWYLVEPWQDPRLIAEVEPGAGSWVWVEFPAPSPGPCTVWVEAVNPWGRQPSIKVGTSVGEDCPQTLATHLQVELLGMAVPGGYTDVYCYASLEGARAVQVPGGELERGFLEAAAGVANIGPWASGDRKVVVPVPGDEELEIQGDCLGWSPERVLTELGNFSGKYRRDKWDGTPHPLPGSGFEIDVAIKPLGAALDTSGLVTTYGYEDPMMRAPYDVSLGAAPPPAAIDPLARGLSWKWDGDPNSISGFQIWFNGVLYNAGGGWSLVDPRARWYEVRLPRDCDMDVTWLVRAVAGPAHSPWSAVSDESHVRLQPCPEPVYAMVAFDTIHFLEDCQDLDLLWFLELNGVTKHFHIDRGTWAHLAFDCGPHSIGLLGRYARVDYPHTIVVYLGEAKDLRRSSQISIEVTDGFWDTLGVLEEDKNVSVHRVLYEFSSLEEAQQALGCGREVCVGPGSGDPLAKEYVGYRATLCYTLYIFPQSEWSGCELDQPYYIP